MHMRNQIYEKLLVESNKRNKNGMMSNQIDQLSRGQFHVTTCKQLPLSADSKVKGECKYTILFHS